MNISVNGFYDHTLTFKVADTLPVGTLVKLGDGLSVEKANDGDSFVGVLRSCREKCAAVQLKGAVTLSYSGTAPSLGHTALASDGENGVKAAKDGTPVLVLAVHETAGTVTCIL